MRTDGGLRRTLALCLAIILTFALGCDHTGEVDPVRPDALEGLQISLVDAPALWVYGSNAFRDVSIRLDLDESMRDAVLAGDVPTPAVWLRIVPPIGETQDVRLADDGSAFATADTASFLASSSGDLVAHDFIYSLRLNSGFATVQGDYEFRFVAAGADAADTTYDQLASRVEAVSLTAEVSVAVNQAPLLDGEDSTFPDSLHSGFATQTWVLLVTDPDAEGGDVVTGANLQILRQDAVLRNLILTDSGSDQWTLRADSSFSSGISTGDVLFRFTATDGFGETSQPLDTTVWIENTPPTLSEPGAPDSVFIPSSGANDYTLTVRVTDSQGPGDLNRVYYTAEDPQGVLTESPDFVFADNGVAPDETANDGIWTAGVSVPSTNTNTGSWTFRFYGEDRAGNTSDAATVPIVMEHEP